MSTTSAAACRVATPTLSCSIPTFTLVETRVCGNSFGKRSPSKLLADAYWQK
ncbi:MAG: hypothetical protein ACLU0O_04040 [Collinsella sp.]